MARTGLAASAAALLCVLSLDVRAATIAAWTEMVGDAQSIRAIATDACPMAEADGKPVPLAVRSAADDTAGFPVISCQAMLPKGAHGLTVDGQRFPVLPARVNRIVVIGDTGCRLKGDFVQDCNDPVAWPFAAIAARAATEKPDLVIHVGDYFYRETPCPAARPGCAGSPYGDAWAAWKADFFDPAAPLLAAAPWIAVRGNHEQCGRGALGWFRFLDAGRKPLACPAAEAPFTVTLGKQRLYVVDSADTEDDKAPPDKVALFRRQLAALRPRDESGAGWILTHRPFWGFTPPGSGEIGESDEMPTNRTEQQAVKGDALAGVQMILSGHVHLFSASDFGGARPSQLIVGVSGDTRDGAEPGLQARKVKIAGLAASTEVVEQFGYLVLDRAAKGWNATLKSQDGSALANCTIRGRALDCAAP
jgi:predicted phosphodiesterase